ncbi:hypothetical protein BGX38DRAFT_1098669 [Terfezia claveryi]|nr:hypothetical protein BGX38DRAFT_1098669 [Terfezia claveryi]
MSELDDHRNQPHSLPRYNQLSSPITARSPSISIAPACHGRPDLSIFTSELGRTSRCSSRVSNEHAIVDEEHEGPAVAFPDSARSGIDRGVSALRGRAEGCQYEWKPPSRSTSRSPSPPNSVEAFADPDRRRDRSGTVSSHAPTELLLQLRRTISRRATFDDGEGDGPLQSRTPSVHEGHDDVCFPMPDEKKNFCSIDFEEMEEFVAEQKALRSGQRKMSVSSTIPGNAYYKIKIDEQSSGEDSGIGYGSDEKATNRDRENRESRPKNPDRFTFFSSYMDSTIHVREFGDLLNEEETFEGLFRGGEGVWWLDCFNPTEDEQRMLMKAFSVHPLTAEDIRVQETREKVELFKAYYFTCFRSFDQDKTSEEFMEPVNVYIIVFREGVLSFYFKPAPHSTNVRRRIAKLRDYVALSSDWICYALIDDITDSFGPVIHEIEQETDAIEDAVFVARTDDHTLMLKQIGECRKKVMGLMRLLGGKADVIKGFAKRCNEQYSVTPRGEIGLYLGDIQDHIITMMGNLAHSEKMLSRSHSNYLAYLSVEAIQTNNRANEVLGKITTIATILVPLNLICGLFGMNVSVPGGRDGGDLYWFFGIVGAIITFIILSYLYARKMKYI